MRAIALASLALACGKSSSDEPAARASDDARPEPSAAAAADARPGGVTPTWTVEVEGDPTLPVMTSVVGPVVAGDAVIVGSSAVGVAALDAHTGKLLWQRAVEDHPFCPRVRDGAVLVTGTCTQRAPKDPRPDNALGCMESVRLSDGNSLGFVWVTDKSDLEDPPCAPPSGEVTVLFTPHERVVRARVSVDKGVLRGQLDGSSAWVDDGRWSPHLWSSGHGTVYGIQQAVGLAPRRIDPMTGPTDPDPDLQPGITVFDARFVVRDPNRPAVAIAARVDASLHNDAVIYFAGEDMRWRWTWPVPRPKARRLDPIGIDAGFDSLYVFYDGRHVARLALD